MTLNKFSKAPTLADGQQSQRLRLNRVDVNGTTIEVWTTSVAAGTTWISGDEIEMLTDDTANRLFPLCKELTKGKKVSTGFPTNNPDWENSLADYQNLDDAIAALQVSIETIIINRLSLQDGVLSISFLQSFPFGSSYGFEYGSEGLEEFSLGSYFQDIICSLKLSPNGLNLLEE